jgi:hypothetical protein
MRTTTCANEAAGHIVRASNSASAIFFIVKESSMELNVSGKLQLFRLVEKRKVSRGRISRNQLEPHSRHFYHRRFICDVPDCSVEFFNRNLLLRRRPLRLKARIECNPATKPL